jgi:hypothetical protein
VYRRVSLTWSVQIIAILLVASYCTTPALLCFLNAAQCSPSFGHFSFHSEARFFLSCYSLLGYETILVRGYQHKINVRFYVSVALKFECGVSIYWKTCCQNLRSYVIGYDVPVSWTICWSVVLSAV